MSHPEIMRHASVDLCATVDGHFSPQDWDQILKRAETQWRERLRLGGWGELEAWQDVVREFHSQRYWGFRPNYRPPKVKKERNLGITMLMMVFNSMLTIKLAVLWFGQIYSRSDEPFDKWIFFATLVLAVGNYGYFLWRYRAYQD